MHYHQIANKGLNRGYGEDNAVPGYFLDIMHGYIYDIFGEESFFYILCLGVLDRNIIWERLLIYQRVCSLR